MSTTSLFFSAFASRLRLSDNQLLLSAAGAEGDGLRVLLAATAPGSLSPDQIRTEVEGHLWMLTPEAFRYFLPAFLNAGVQHYSSLGNFVTELIEALTEPSPDDVQEALDRVAQIPAGMGLTPNTLALLKQQQLDWYDSGMPLARFTARVHGLSLTEGTAVLAFLIAIRNAHGEDFPFHEPQIAIDRHWARYLPTARQTPSNEKHDND